MLFQNSSGSKTLSRAVIQATKNYPTRGNMAGDRTDYEHGQKSCLPCKMKDTKWTQRTKGNKCDYFFLQDRFEHFLVKIFVGILVGHFVLQKRTLKYFNFKKILN